MTTSTSDASLPIRLFSASRDGQAVRIAARLAERIGEHGVPVVHVVLDDHPVAETALVPARMVVLVAAIHYGYHHRRAGMLMRAYRRLEAAPPFAMVTVCLTARKPNRKTAEDNPYLRKFLRRHAVVPVAAAAIAGLLDYKKLRWLDRQLVRLIMVMMKGPTDGVSRVEYTDWNEVDAFADRLAAAASHV